MAAFNADVKLDLLTGPAERQLQKIERGIDRVEAASRDILAVDKQIVAEKSRLLRLEGQAAQVAQNNIRGLRQQKSELVLQKRELSQIVALERRRAKGSVGGAVQPAAGGGISDGAGVALSGSVLQKAEKRFASLKDQFASFDQEYEESVKNTVANNAELQASFEKNQSNLQRVLAQREKLAKKFEILRRLEANPTGGGLKGQSYAQSLNNTRNSIKGLTVWLDKYQSELDQSTASMQRLTAATERNAKASAGAVRKQKRFQAQAKGAGAAALAGGAFANIPGSDLLQAGAAGALVGGPKGAVIAALVAGTAKLVQFGAASAKTAAEVDKLKIALEGVAGANFNAALATARRTTDDFNLPLTDSIANITKLTAAANAVGLSFEDVDTIIRGLSASNKALGGTAETLNGTLNAGIQILSKGKVQAEELRGQIGDRLPGAFGRFAQALGISTAELDERLKDGKVTVRDFVTFSAAELAKFEKDAKKIADGPEEAGARLERAMKDLEIALGPITKSIGAAFQTMAQQIVDSITASINWLNRLNQASAELDVNTLITSRNQLQERLAAMRANQGDGWGQASAREIAEVEKQLRRTEAAAKAAQERLNALRAPVSTGAGASNPPPVVDPALGGGGTGGTGATDNVAERLFLARTAAVEAAQILELEKKINAAKNAGLQKEVAILQGEQEILKIRNQLAIALESETSELVRQELKRKAAIDADKVGLDVAQRLLELTKDRTEALKQQASAAADVVRAGAGETQGAVKDRTSTLRNLQNISKFGSESADLIRRVEDLVINKGVSFSEAFELEKAIDEQQRLADAVVRNEQLMASAAQRIGQALEDGIVSSIEAAIKGTEDLGRSLQQLASDVLGSLGRMFLNAGISGIGSALKLPGYAEGGFVDRPTAAVVGEGSQPEYIIPANNMKGAMQRWNAGHRGDAVINGPEVTAVGGAAPGAEGAPMNFSFNTVRIADQEFVSKEQLTAAMLQASKSGAELGERKALRRMQMSPTTRRKLGM